MSSCTAPLYHGPGHQSRTLCQREAGHKPPHRCTYGSARQVAEWEDGVYTSRLRERGIEFNPESYPENLGMTGFFDEPPQSDE